MLLGPVLGRGHGLAVGSYLARRRHRRDGVDLQVWGSRPAWILLGPVLRRGHGLASGMYGASARSRGRLEPACRGRRHDRSARERPGRRHGAGRRCYRLDSGPVRDELAAAVDKDGVRYVHPHRLNDRAGNKGLLCRNGQRTGKDLNVRETARIDSHRGLARRASRGKVFMAHCRKAIGAVDIGDVGDIDDIHIGVLHVDVTALADIGDIHAVNVMGTAVVPGAVGFAGTEGKPSRDTYAADLDATCEGNQGRRPDRVIFTGTRQPTPTAAVTDPAAIVEWRIAPRLILDPDPAPRLLVHPAAVAVGRPVGIYVCREPDGAVFAVLHPIAIGVQVSSAGDIRAYIVVGNGLSNPLVALLAPGVQVVRVGGLQPLRIYGIGARQFKGLRVFNLLIEPVGSGDPCFRSQICID